MKRWDIKSAYPMPRQLKDAAEKKKRIKEMNQELNQGINSQGLMITDAVSFDLKQELNVGQDGQSLDCLIPTTVCSDQSAMEVNQI
jgi:hypothetical protein